MRERPKKVNFPCWCKGRKGCSWDFLPEKKTTDVEKKEKTQQNILGGKARRGKNLEQGFLKEAKERRS